MMKKKKFLKAVFIALFLQSAFINPSFGQSEPVPFSKLFYGFGSHFIGSFTYNYGLNHLAGIGLTYGMVKSGLDWDIHTFANKNTGVQYSGFPSVIIGGLVPLILPVSLYYYAGNRENYELQNTALALGQAAILSLTISSIYKAGTGRKPPADFGEEETRTNYSKDFRFGFFERGIFDGWPSGHATTAFAMATTLVELYPQNDTIRYSAYSYAAFIAAGIAVNIHWASDAIAGALMGYAIGKTVGRGFYSKTKKYTNLIITPTLSGISLIWRF